MLTLGLLNRNTGCQRCSVRCSSMLKLLCISIHSSDFQNFNFSTVRTVKRVELHHYAKFCEIAPTAAEIWRFYEFSRWRTPPCWIFKISNFNRRKGQEGRSASVCQISSKSLELRMKYGYFSNFKMTAAAILDFQNLKFLTFGTVKRVELRNHAKFCRNRSNRGRDIVI